MKWYILACVTRPHRSTRCSRTYTCNCNYVLQGSTKRANKIKCQTGFGDLKLT